MKYFLIALLTLISLPSQAKFYPTDTQEISIPSGVQTAINASIKYSFEYDNHSAHCSATVISPEGIILTARHCIDSCLKEKRRIKNISIGPNSRDEYLVYDHAPGDQCPILLPTGENTAIYASAEVLALGQAEIPNPLAVRFDVPEKYFTLLDHGIAFLSGDFAILRVPELKGSVCAPVSEKEIKPGTKIWTASYPGKSTRLDHNSDGINKFVSYGEAKESTLTGENPTVLEIVEAAKEHPELLDIFRDSFDLPHLIISDVDFIGGSSGSGLFDEEGNLVGLNSSGSSTPSKYYKDTSISLRLSWIRAVLEANYPDLKFSKLFNCERN